MSHSAMRAASVKFLALFAGFTLHLSAQTDGLFADFTTSLGNFSCSLNYTAAPKAVASFIGLATGEQPWMDLNTGTVRAQPFYNGLTFHRVISGFMIQAGSPNGLGTDGPGYTFQDELNPSLKHDGAGVLSMANSGSDSNGSQFFVTAAAASFLDGGYTIFGRAVSGLDVVTNINRVATDANDKPRTNVVIQSIAIRRVGAAAKAFNARAQGLPIVTNLPVQLSVQGTNANLSFSNRLFADNRFFMTTNLVNWTSVPLGFEVVSPTTNSMSANASAPQEFFRLAQVQYPTSTFTPRSVQSRTLTLNLDGGNGTLIVKFDQENGGTYTFGTDKGTLTRYTWLQDAFVGRLSPILYSSLVPMVLRLNFTAAGTGKFTGTAYGSTSTFPVSGSFSMSP